MGRQEKMKVCVTLTPSCVVRSCMSIALNRAITLGVSKEEWMFVQEAARGKYARDSYY